MRVILTLIIIAFAGVSVKAQDPVTIFLNMRNNEGYTYTPIEFGLHKDATYDIDEDLGEKEYVAFPDPDNNYGALYIFEEDSSSIKYMLKDYRPYEDLPFYKLYNLQINPGLGDSVFIRWSKLPDGLDSAKFTDAYGGNVTSFDMKQKDTIALFIPGSFYQYQIHLYFGTINSKRDKNQDDILLFPNPAEDHITINYGNNLFYFNIYSAVSGEVLKGMAMSEQEIDISAIAPGYYFIKLTPLYGGTVKYLKFIKNRE
ncbi:MAG: T9SS type A sorting domain-containing protein [Candidatus Kapaibacterium sp.]